MSTVRQIDGQMSIFDILTNDDVAVNNRNNSFDPVEVYVLHGSGFVDGKIRIKKYFQKNKNKKDRIAFLKKEYGTGGFSCHCDCKDKRCVVYGGDHDTSGHSIKYIDENGSEDKISITYNVLADVIDKLIALKSYN